MTPTPRPVREAILRLFRDQQRFQCYRHFRRTVRYNSLMSCWVVWWNGMLIGIEHDGYTHS